MQNAFLIPVVFQVSLDENNPYAEVARFGAVYSATLHQALSEALFLSDLN